MEIKELVKKVACFRDERDWSQYHNPKDLSICLSREASELLELFLWKDPHEVKKAVADGHFQQRIREELGDVFICALNIASALNMNPEDLICEKLEINGEKYPVQKAKGRAEKYTAYTSERRNS